MNEPLQSTTLSPAASRPALQPDSALRRFFHRQRGDSPFKQAIIHVVLICACLIAIYPVLRVVSISLRPGNNVVSTSLSIIPAGASLDSYRKLFTQKDFLLWLWNSLIVTLITSTLGLALAATGAYAFSRWKFPGRRAGLLFLLTTQMIPAGMLLIPLYILVVRLNLFNTYRGIIIAYATTAVPFSIWMIKGYFDTVPIDLEEAAKIDGASQMGAFWRVILPLSTPSLAIAFLFNFMGAWSEFIVAKTLLQKPELRTWPLGIQELSGQFTTEWNTYAAAAVLIMIPVVSIFLYFSKYFVGGLTLGGVKG
jgi:arabinogalactan oligomer / maltooligosaccharide transport system permease protein